MNSKLNTGKLEIPIAHFSMNISRDAAWQVAINYAALDTEEKTQRYLAERDSTVDDFSKKNLHSGTLVKTVSGMFRVFDFGNIAKKIQRLNA